MLSGVINRLSEYFKLKAEQIKLEVMARVAKLLSQVIVLAGIVILGLFFVLFLSFALSSFLNEILASNYLGYLIVAGAYLLALIILGIMGKKGTIQEWIESSLLEMNEKLDEDDE